MQPRGESKSRDLIQEENISLPADDGSNRSSQAHKRPERSKVHTHHISPKHREREVVKILSEATSAASPRGEPFKDPPHGLKRPPPAKDDTNQTPRPRKRPGGAARVSVVDKEAVLRRQQEREDKAREEAEARGVHDVVRQHYNAVPERGIDWRKTDSCIKGLRSFNNWVKSTIIHKFSPADDGHGPPLRVLDLGCGKGGDLGKWQQAPQPVELLVGIDPAEVSVDQARERHARLRGGHRGGRGGRGGRSQRTFDAEFFAQDAFGESIGNIPLIRQIGFDTGMPGSRRNAGGFDVVSMMFCMHYAFESEAKTRGMLQNVAGSLAKGGRFIGTIPNSDVIRSRVEAFHKEQEELQRIEETHDPEPFSTNTKDDATSNSQSPRATEPNGQAVDVIENPTKIDIHLPLETKSSGTSYSQSLPTPPSSNNTHLKPLSKSLPPKVAEAKVLPVAEWGNSIYRVRFPGLTPKDGVFRPPFGWKYSYFMEEAVEEIPEYVVPWEAFRA